MKIYPSAIDDLAAGMSLDARGVLTDLLLRTDESGRLVTNITEYSQTIHTTRRRTANTIAELEGHRLVIADFRRGHEGTIDLQRPALACREV